jgi:hypothetical protein
MCLALGNPGWAYRIPEKCWSKDKFVKLLQDPETYYKEKAEKEQRNQGDKEFERISYQSQTPRRQRGDRQGQSQVCKVRRINYNKCILKVNIQRSFASNAADAASEFTNELNVSRIP